MVVDIANRQLILTFILWFQFRRDGTIISSQHEITGTNEYSLDVLHEFFVLCSYYDANAT